MTPTCALRARAWARSWARAGAQAQAQAGHRHGQGPAHRAKPGQWRWGWKQHPHLPAHRPSGQRIGSHRCRRAGALRAGVRPMGQGRHRWHRTDHPQLHGAACGRHRPCVLWAGTEAQPLLPRPLLRPHPGTLCLTRHDGSGFISSKGRLSRNCSSIPKKKPRGTPKFASAESIRIYAQ